MIIAWLVNGTDTNNKNITQLSIITNGAGSPNSSLTIPGYPQYNNTGANIIEASVSSHPWIPKYTVGL